MDRSVAADTATTTWAIVPWRSVLEIFKPRIGFEIMLAAVAGAAMSTGSPLSPGRLAILAAAVFLAAAAAGAVNHLAERDIDARMSRTRARPFVTGTLRNVPLWSTVVLLLLALAVAAAALAANWLAAGYTFLGAFTYGVVYTLWLKRRTWLNIVVGGLAGSFAVLAGAVAVDPQPGPAAWTLAVVLFLWTPPHFWSLAMYHREDYARAGVPMLPVVHGDRIAARAIFAHTLLLVLLSLLPALWGAGPIYLVCAALGGAWFLQRSFRLLREPTSRNAIRNFIASLGQLGLLLLGAIIDGAIDGRLVAF
ncbi:MAG: protoheme IX farnesyltransferase [Gammaproteobacteria bacterium]|nr:protoheme IX farnesyltransferase [Gammaproteobacteria bacterium]